MRTILQRPHTCIPRWLYRVFPGYYKVLSLANSVSTSQQSLPTPQSVSSFSRPSSGVKVSVIPTIEESPELKVHCLSFDSESKRDDLSDSKNASDRLQIKPTMYDKMPSKSDGVENSDSRYPNLSEATHKIDDGDEKAANNFVEFVYPIDETTSEETIRAFVWPMLTHGIHISNSNSDLVASKTPSRVSISKSGLKNNPQSVSIGCSSP